MRVDTERHQINEEVFCEYGSETWTWEAFQQIMNRVPEQYREDTTVELDGDDTCKLTITYWRDETGAEYDQRIQRERNTQNLYEARAEVEERATWERLNAKYGSGGTAAGRVIPKHAFQDTRLAQSPLRG
jgi:hypothetical protein